MRRACRNFYGEIAKVKTTGIRNVRPFSRQKKGEARNGASPVKHAMTGKRDGSVTAIAAAAAAKGATATTTTAATEGTATTAAAATEGATATLFFRAGLVDREVTTAHVLAIDARDGRLGFRIGTHRHEGESAGTTAEFIHRDEHFGYGTMLRKQITQLALSRAESQITHIQF
jgi:hypothetical protein